MKEHNFDITVKGINLEFCTTPGIFSWKALDKGTYLLLPNLSIRPSDNILDIGCGYGPIGIYCAKLALKGTVQMIDKDFVAVEYANKNCTLNNVTNAKAYLSNGFSHVPKNATFDTIVSNLPAHMGKEVWQEMISESAKRLMPKGKFYVVTISRLKPYIKRTFTDTFGNYEKLDHTNQYVVSLATKK